MARIMIIKTGCQLSIVSCQKNQTAGWHSMKIKLNNLQPESGAIEI